MKFCYLGKFNENPYSVLLEERISGALSKLGHQVYEFDVMKGNADELIKQANKSDYFLFHNGGIETAEELGFFMGLNGFMAILSQIKCKKVMWFVDKVIAMGGVMVERTIPQVDYAFLNDETWIRRHKYPNAFGLHLGTADRPLGKYNKDFECEIAYVGRVYGDRFEMMSVLKKRYGGKFRVFEDIWGKDFDDLCQTAKIIISPRFPMDDFCWNSQIYDVLGTGGFSIHPRLYGLKEEGIEDGVHYVGYTIFTEAVAEIEADSLENRFAKLECPESDDVDEELAKLKAKIAERRE